MHNIIFQKATKEHQDMIFAWLEEPHVKEFWDSSQAHKDDIINFIDGRKTPSNYAKGKYEYWIGSKDDVPYAMLMIIPNSLDDDIDNIYIENLSKFGNTYAIDFMIGNPNFIGKGLGAKTLSKFMDFYRENIDKKADTFQIDPEARNERAKHVYEKAGFEHIDDFVMTGNHSGAGKSHHFLAKKFSPIITLAAATIDDYPATQNMARFYVYDMSRYCGHYKGWECPKDGLFECIDFKHYFENPDEEVYFIKVNDEVAGFVMLDKKCLIEPVDWNMGQFFVLAKFQGHGIAQLVAKEIFMTHKGKWSVSVIVDNVKALKFWKNTISEITQGKFKEAFKTKEDLLSDIEPDPYPRIFFTFEI